MIEHSLFGKGKILSIEGTGLTMKITVLFHGNVKKKLIANGIRAADNKYYLPNDLLMVFQSPYT